MDDSQNLSDEKIVEKVRASDQDLFAVLMDRYQSKLFRYVNKLMKDKDKTIDVVQEAFIKAFINLNSFDSSKKFSSWIYRIAHNEAMNGLKKYRKEVQLPDDFDMPSEENTIDNLEKEENSQRVLKCLDEIPLIYSEPLVLYYYENKSYAEISEILHLPVGTVSARLNRGKVIMKKICQKSQKI